jgi:DNA invertase Pin-like site-specific DNA recombinase
MLTLPANCAALYVRASTEHQNYSTSHQEAALREYAAQHACQIVSVYRDEGRSGLTLEGRTGLIQLLTDIQSGHAQFTQVLVYDISRWGRFQDVDESASYEYACRRAGISIAYCAEPFANDGSPLATLLKGLKRAMAAEYSRELSAKVLHAQCRHTMSGFKQGGSAGFGLRRLCISASGAPRRVLEMGERKSMPTDRVIYVLGPQEEVDAVRRIFRMCTQQHMPDTRIADVLNEEGLKNQHGRPWSAHNVKAVLTNEKYTGTLIFNRSTQLLKSSRRPNDPDKWVRSEGAFEGIITNEYFDLTRALRLRRGKHWSNDELLDGLRDIFVEHGRVTAELINGSGVPSVKSYALRFGGLVAAMAAAGVAQPSVSETTITRFRLRCVTRDTVIELRRCAALVGVPAEQIGPRTFKIKNVVVRVLCSRCRFERSHPCWKVALRHSPAVDFILWVRMNITNESIAQYYLLPIEQFPEHRYIWPSSRTLIKYDQFAFGEVKQMFGLG